VARDPRQVLRHPHRRRAPLRGHGEPAVRHWERVCQLLGPLPETRERLSLAAAARAQILWIEARRGAEQKHARALYEQARDFAERAGDLSSLARTRYAYATFLFYAGEPGGADMARQALTEAARSGDLEVRIVARWACAVFGNFAESWAEAARHASAALDLCGDDLEVGAAVLGYRPGLIIRGRCGAALIMSGRLTEGATMIAQTLDDRGRRHRLTHAACGCFTVVESQLRGEYRAALGVVQRSVETLEELGATAGVRALVHLYLGQSLALSRAWDAAREALEQALQLTAGNTFRQIVPDIHTWLAHVALTTGDLERARRDLDTGFAHAQRQELWAPLVAAHIIRARLLIMEGDPAAHVERELAEADKVAIQVGAAARVPEIHCERAAVCRRDGRLKDARRELERARDLYREMGARPNADRIAVETEALAR
jgi:tetratricopeptide (TPR) repeat protein